jgi:hypothetical protein
LKTPVVFILVSFFVLLFASCKTGQDYGKYIRELDSLKVVTEQAVDNFNAVDSSAAYEACSRQYTYRIFLATHLKDTVSKEEAEGLAGFFSTEKPLADYLAMRPVWLSEARAVIKQVGLLSNDLKNGSVEHAEAVEFISDEKKRSEKLIEELKTNTVLVRKHLDLYAKHRSLVESTVKARNSGILPALSKPELKRL